ncbi:carbon-nitrogen hydrolase family protein [Amycolatopsis rifamycinica]|nr:carbon-nitrogen hydrolase family protein [Amycolatopsis rifamycinica]
MPELMRVTVCQLDNRPGHRTEAIAALADHARAAGADLVLLPEMPFSTWLGADPEPDAARWLHSVDEHRRVLAGLAFEDAAVIGSMPTAEPNGSWLNQAFVWNEASGAAAIRAKHYLPDEPGYWEATWYDRAEASQATCRVGRARVGVSICTEMWFLHTASRYAKLGVDLLCVPRVTPEETLAKWLAGGQATAVCSGAYCLSSNQWVPEQPGIAAGGLGWAIDPDGNVLATTSPGEPFVTVEVDLDLARQAKRTYPRYVAGLER